MASSTQNVAVFTGDIVNSTQLTKAQLSAAFDVLESCAEKAAEWHGASLQFTRHRGDGWQVILNQPKYALRTALYFRASLKALGQEFDTYIGIATGQAEAHKDNDLNERNEGVFIFSGRALESTKNAKNYPLKMLKNAPGADAASTILADYIVEGWTPTQAEAVSLMLKELSEPSFTEVAKLLGKSRQTVTKSLIASGYSSIYLALSLLENQDD